MAALVARMKVMTVEHRRGPRGDLVGVERQPWVDEPLAGMVDSVLARYDSDLEHFLWSIAQNFGDSWPWASIVFPRCYPLADHLRDVRPDAASMPFTPHGRPPDPPPAGWTRCVGAVFATTREVLRVAAGRSPMFTSAWAALAEKAEGSSWICLSHRLDPRSIAAVRADGYPTAQGASRGPAYWGSTDDELMHSDY
jgi:hypothetical protein